MLRRVYPYYVMYLVKYFPILPLCHNPSVHINEFSANLNSTFYLFSSVMIHILLCDVMFFTQDSPINLSMKIPWVIFFPVELCCFTCRTMADGWTSVVTMPLFNFTSKCDAKTIEIFKCFIHIFFVVGASMGLHSELLSHMCVQRIYVHADDVVDEEAIQYVCVP